ncbi:MAG: glycosyltransferase, partial [Verrucomicrobiae bacterium]|nr:glycosyltransferase [Verrucomicrobiae bacterium]
MNRLRVLAVVPTPYVFGLQVVTLDFFSRLREWADCHFLITRWNDGDFPRRLEAMSIPHTTSWLGMFSRKLDPENLRMTLECAYRAPQLYGCFWRLVREFRPDVIYTANNHELILLYPMLRLMRIPVVWHMHDPPPNIPFQRASFRVWRQPVTRFVTIAEDVRDRLVQ